MTVSKQQIYSKQKGKGGTRILLGYDEEWVCQQYREAKYQKKQIKILAECCATTRSEILSILHLNGLALDVTIKPPKSPKPTALWKWTEAIEWLKKGDGYKNAAKKAGVSETSLRRRWKELSRDYCILTEKEIAEIEERAISRRPSNLQNKKH